MAKIDAAAKVAAVRADHIVGHGTCSVIDECYDDEMVAELVAAARTEAGAVKKARAVHRTYHDYADDIAATAF